MRFALYLSLVALMAVAVIQQRPKSQATLANVAGTELLPPAGPVDYSDPTGGKSLTSLNKTTPTTAR